MLEETTISITYSQEPHPCKKLDCPLCQAGKAHPAHWYASTFIDKQERHLYLGSKFRPVNLDEFLKYMPKKAAAPAEDVQPHPAFITSPVPLLLLAAPSKKFEYQTVPLTPAVEPEVIEEPEAPIVNKVEPSNEAVNQTETTHETPQTEPINVAPTMEREVPLAQPIPPKEKAKSVAPDPILPKLPSSKEFHRDLRRFKNVRFKDVKDKYRQLIKKYHPDQFGGQDVQVQEWMKIINMVHEVHMTRMQRFVR